MIFKVEAWDANCPQHIQQSFTQEDIKAITDPLHKKLKDLETTIK